MTEQINTIQAQLEAIQKEIGIEEAHNRKAAVDFSASPHDDRAGQKFRTSSSRLADLRGELKLLNDALGYAQEAEVVAKEKARDEAVAALHKEADDLGVKRMAIAAQIDKALEVFGNVMDEWRVVNTAIAEKRVQANRLAGGDPMHLAGIGRTLAGSCLNAIAGQIESALRELPTNVYMNFRYNRHNFPNRQLVVDEVK